MPARRISIALVLLLILPSAGGVPGVLHNDAGSGRDAPTMPEAAFLVETNTIHRGSSLTRLDGVDTYAFRGTAGDVIEPRAWGGVCYDILRPSGELEVKAGCMRTDGLEINRHVAVLDETGIWYVRITANVGGEYDFVIGRDVVVPDRGVRTVPQDDAGTSRDAPDALHPGFVVDRDVRHTGVLDRQYDYIDSYGFHATAGEAVYFDVSGITICVELFGPDRHAPPGPLRCMRNPGSEPVIISESGTWYLRFCSLVPGTYAFQIRSA